MSGMITSQQLFLEQWAVVRSFLPKDLDKSARESGAMKRQRGQIQDAETLLKLLLMHIAGGLSLEQTVARAHLQGLPKINAMALHKRLCNAHQWFTDLTTFLLEGIRPFLNYQDDCWKINRNVRILDATDIQETGVTGSDWRVHYSLRLPQLYCDYFELTDHHVAESLRRLPINKGDLILVDRGYNDRKEVSRLIKCGADVIMRYNSGAFPLLDSYGNSYDPLVSLRQLKIGEYQEFPVSFSDGKSNIPIRMCALRKSPEQVKLTQAKIMRRAQRNSSNVRKQTLEYAEYVIIICTVPNKDLTLVQVLEFYRARWQVELAFKRLKTLLSIGQLPKKKPEACKAWMQGKILTALLIERMMCEQSFFSPWGYRL